MKRTTLKPRVAQAAAITGLACFAGYAGTLQAAQFDIGDITTVRLQNLFTVGASFRMQRPDFSNIGKSTVAQMMGRDPICIGRVGDDGVSGPNTDGENRFFGDTCNPGVADPEFGDANRRFVAEPGSFSPNSDKGNTNFDRYDLVHATAKLTTDVTFDLSFGDVGINFFARPLFYFDRNMVDFQELNPDTTLNPRFSALPSQARRRSGSNFQVLDAFASTNLPFVFDRTLQLKVGKQVLNWGESSFLLFNSLNSVNPPNAALLRIPGFDLKELQQPVGMVFAGVDLTHWMNLEAFYQYDWKPLIIDPPGTFQSPSDTLGEGGTYAMLAFAKVPNDPLGLYEPWRNPQDPAAVLGSRSSRTIFRDFDEERARRPSQGGQFGVALRTFLEGVNNGTELNFYFANLHSRLPVASAFAAEASCIPPPGDGTVPTTGTPLDLILGQLGAQAASNVADLVAACGIPAENFFALAGAPGAEFGPASGEAIPLDTVRLIVEHPEDLRMYGVSFNTTVGQWAWSGEYVFRDNLPVQVHTTDLIFAALQPAFPAEDFSLGAATLPGRRTALPDFVTEFRGGVAGEVEPGEYIRGYESMKQGQANLTFLRLLGGDNPIGASQITLLVELGYTHLLDFPDLSEIQFQGAGTNTHISSGADGTQGIDPPDHEGQEFADNLRQNPTAHADLRGFGTKSSYGYRIINLSRYDNALLGANIELLAGVFHDVRGVGPGIGQNFVEGRRTFLAGVRFDYLSRWVGEVRYTWLRGKRDGLRDRDNLLIWAGYQF